MRTTSRETRALLERDDALDQLRRALAAASAGAGSAVVLTGPPGLGKTTVLDAGAALAGDSELRVLRARGSESEQAFPFGGALQLLEGATTAADRTPGGLLSGAAALARPVLEGRYLQGDGGPVASAVHGLFWLTVNLARDAPLALVVDDLHAIDDPSLAYLLYLARRIAELPVALVATTRPVEARRRPALAELVYERSVVDVSLAPLSRGAVAALVRRELGPEADEGFCDACARVSGGVPFYLEEMLRALELEGAGSGDDAARRLADVEPGAVSRAVLLRVARLDDAAQQLARACAVVGTGAPLDVAARAADLPVDEGLRAADELVGAAILASSASTDFVHDLIRAALLADLSPAEQAQLHLRAADVLSGRHAPAERIAVHLVHAPPTGDPAHVDALATAAQHAIDAGLPGTAVRYLERALEEPPPTRERRVELLLMLTRAQIAVDPAAAAERLAEVRALGVEAHDAARLQLLLSRALSLQGRHREAAEAALTGARMLPEEDPLARELVGSFITASIFVADLRERGMELAGRLVVASRADPTPSERSVLAQAATHHVTMGGPLREVRETVELAWGDGALLRAETADGIAWTYVTAALGWGGDYAAMERVASEALADARRRGSIMAFATASYIRAAALLWQGRLVDALADIEATLEVHRLYGWRLFVGMARYLHAEILLERGDVEEAAQALASAEDADYADSAEGAALLYARGRVRLAQGQAEAALRDLEAARDLARRTAASPPRFLPWWDGVAEATARLGDAASALAVLAETEPMVRRAELPGVLARSLVTRSRLEEHDAALATLHEAVEAAGRSQSRLEHARAKVELGGRLRRAGRRTEALDVLKGGLDLAHRLGAGSLERRARDELAVLGARPRRALASGIDALTASELRTARLAAEGLTNREIAEALFVTPKTVEYHLRNAFAKLGVAGRRELAGALR